MNLLFPIKLSLYLLVLHTVWISARAGAHKRRRIRGPNVYLVTLQKDTEALSQWINYHGDIFGYDKLYILDGHSSEETLEELQSFEAVGVHTFHRHSKKLNQLASNLVGKSGRLSLNIYQECPLLNSSISVFLFNVFVCLYCSLHL